MTRGDVVGAGVIGVDIASIGLWFVENRSSRSNRSPDLEMHKFSHEVKK